MSSHLERQNFPHIKDGIIGCNSPEVIFALHIDVLPGEQRSALYGGQHLVMLVGASLVSSLQSTCPSSHQAVCGSATAPTRCTSSARWASAAHTSSRRCRMCGCTRTIDPIHQRGTSPPPSTRCTSGSSHSAPASCERAPGSASAPRFP